MAQNLQLDPTTKDYVVTNGTPVPSDRVLEKCYYALLIPENKYMYGQNGQGSFLYTLANTKRTSDLDQKISSYATDAINRQVINKGDATFVQVTNLISSQNGSSNQIDVVPSATSISNQLNFTSV